MCMKIFKKLQSACSGSGVVICPVDSGDFFEVVSLNSVSLFLTS